MEVYLVTGNKYSDGSGCYGDLSSAWTLGVYSTKLKAERVRNWLENKGYSNYDEFEVLEKRIK